MPEKEDPRYERLVKLADLMETCDYGDSFHRELSREYKAISKALFPDMHKLSKQAQGPGKLRKPSAAFIRTIKKCACGYNKFTLKRDEAIQLAIECPNCGQTSGPCCTISKARDIWNGINS